MCSSDLAVHLGGDEGREQAAEEQTQGRHRRTKGAGAGTERALGWGDCEHGRCSAETEAVWRAAVLAIVTPAGVNASHGAAGVPAGGLPGCRGRPEGPDFFAQVCLRWGKFAWNC